MRQLLIISLAFLSFSARAAESDAKVFQPFDDEYRLRRNFSRFQIALNGYRQFVSEMPDSVEANWRLAMACTYLGLRVEKDDDRIKAAFNEGREAALKALEKDPDCVPCHFWRAVNQVLYANRVGILKVLFSVKEVRGHFRFVAEKDPGFLSGGALRFLAIIDWKLPGVLGGDADRAKENFERSLKYGATEPMNYEYYHDFLVDTAEEAEADALLKRVASLPEPDLEMIESHDSWGKMTALAKSSGHGPFVTASSR